MGIFVNFTDPLSIKGNNKVITSVVDLTKFKSKADPTMTLSPDKAVMMKEVPDQLPKGVSAADIKAQAETTKNAMMGVAVIQLVASVFLKGVMNDLWSLFFTLQIMVYIKCYDVSIPAVAQIYIKQF